MGQRREPFTQLFVHLVWSTWRRRPMLTPAIRGRVYAALQAKCFELKGEAIAIGGIEDHVHLVVRMPASLPVSKLVQHLKGSTSHLINHEGPEGSRLRWQGGYGAFSISRRHVPVVRRYVQHQEQRHRTRSLNPALEATAPP